VSSEQLARHLVEQDKQREGAFGQQLHSFSSPAAARS
jgi:hypothetical protein